MAGDHKCPVCNSTFTRPQHVARHMRSHTGDRPYKCQHCGDQFARSDLLSRHINKCHASEKPPTTTAPNNRRKGTAAASRATTSKQACDQCVTSSLPCDGCNPCSKCVQRKVRCTYVKFHRQTAPAGPGHAPPNAMPNVVHRGQIGMGGRIPDEFLLPTGAAGTGLAPMYLPPDYALPVSSLYASHPYDTRPSTAPSLNVATTGRDSIDTSPDVMARYRAQAEMLSRAGVLPNGAINPMGTSATMIPGMYATDQSNMGRYGIPASQGPAWTQHGGHPFPGKDLDDYGAPADGRSFPGGGGSAALPSHPPAHGAPFSDLSTASGHAHSADSRPDAYGGGSIPFPQHHSGQGHRYGHNRRSEELSDEFGSEGVASVPSSANSSSVHLPMVDQHEPRRPYTAESASPTLPYQHNGHKEDGTGEGGFSSAFGLMSLDDPNVLAGLANDAAPFFSALPSSSFSHGGDSSASGSASASSASLHSDVSNDTGSHTSHTTHSSVDSSNGMGLNLPTPTPELLASWRSSGLLSAGGKDGLDSKELRDFWKQYMRTPLTGPGSSSSFFPLQTPTGPGQQLGMGGSTASGSRPSPTRRHSRVASLPSMKTPPIFGAGNSVQEFNHFAPSGNFSLSLGPKARDRQQQTQRDGEPQHQQTQLSFSNVRSTLHGDAEDLKSYEQAVLARKAPTTLNLVPRRRGTLPPGSSPPTMKNMSPPQLPASAANGVGSLSQTTNSNSGRSSGSNNIGELLNGERPGSSSMGLAEAYNSHSPTQHHDHHVYQQQYLQEQQYHSQSSESPRESSIGAESDGANSTSYRPSFKRLASQTLGPENAKRALLGPAGWEDADDAIEDEEDVESEEARRNRRFAGRGYGLSQAARRFSMPTSSGVTLPPLRSTQSQEGQGSPVPSYAHA